MVFQKPRQMGRVTGRERGGCWEVLSRCSGIGVRESSPGLSLTAEISCFPGGSEGVYCLAAALIRGVCNLCDAKGFPFAPLLLFPRNTAVCQPLFCAAVHLHTPRMLGQSFIPIYPKCCHPPSFALPVLDHSHSCCIGFLMRSNRYECVNHPFWLSLPLHPLFCGF